MAVAGFEEKQYETAANIELGHFHEAVHSPGQVLEAVVGYDVAAHQPSNAPIWKILGTPAPPGIVLVPNFWQRSRGRPKAAELPSHYVSVILQYKRPEHLSRSNATQWHFWHSAYYRFAVYAEQHEVLRRLATRLAERAITAYASAVFSAYWQLEQHQLKRQVLANSNFVDPNSIGNHSVWTYQEAGMVGKPNPSGQAERSFTFKDWWYLARERGGRKENLYEHLRGLAQADDISPIVDELPEWLMLLDNMNLEPIQRQGVLDVVELGQRLGFTNASWFVIDFGD